MKKYIIGLLLFCTVISCQPDKGIDFKPNILWITCEDISPFLGSYGDSEATTPNLDQLAKEGVRYTNFFANAPVCSPARFTILHGVHASSAGTMNMRSRYKVPDEWLTYPEYLKEAGYYCTNNAKTDYNFSGNQDVWDESSQKAHYKNRAQGQPFFAVFNFTSSHESKIHKYDSSELIHDPDKMILPSYVPDNEAMRNDMAKLYDNITKMDGQAGEILKELDEAGLRDSTIVFYYSDHGGVFPRSKRYIHRTGTWVPLITRVPYPLQKSFGKGGSVSERLVSFVDLAPTVLSIAGVEAPDYMEGKAFMGEFIQDPQEEIFLFRNRMDERIDFQRAITDGKYRYHRNFIPHRPYGQHLGYLWRAASIRSWEQAYLNGECNEMQSRYWEEKDFEELYDMEADPWEVNNLAENEEYADVLTKMQKRLTERMLELNDAGALPEGLVNSVNDYTDVYSYVRDSAYPLDRVLKLSPHDYADGLLDESAVVRYWAAVFASSDKRMTPEIKGVLFDLLDDENTEVALAAGEALYRNGHKDLGIQAVRDGMKSDNPKVVLLAFNVLEYFDDADKKLFAEDVKDVQERIDSQYVNRVVEWYFSQSSASQ